MAARIVSAPSVKSPSFNCPHCGAFAHQSWQPLLRRDSASGGFAHGAFDGAAPEDGEEGIEWAQALCAACHQRSTWRGSRLVFPAGSTVPPAAADMPSEAVALYNEAKDVAAVSRRAGAGMARTALEYLLRRVLPELGVTIARGSRLDDLILLVEPQVSSGLQQRLSVVRHAGNKSVHVEDVPDEVMVLVLDEEDDAIMDILFSTINDLVDELITKRKQSADMYDLLPEGVRASIERKRRQSGGQPA